MGFGLWDRILSERMVREAKEEVATLLEKQCGAWNGGDLEAFTSVYAEDAAFLTPKGITRGREEVLRRYRESYPDRETMGRLELEVLEMRPANGIEISMLGDARPGRVHGITVAARWKLAESEGLTLIVFRYSGDRWEIVQDASM
jgi:hypothetical protein